MANMGSTSPYPGTIDFRQLGANQTQNILGPSTKSNFLLPSVPNYKTPTYADQFGLSFGPGGNANNGLKWNPTSGQYAPNPVTTTTNNSSVAPNTQNPNNGFTVLANTKNPALANIQNAYTQQFAQNDAQNQGQWSNYLKSLGSVQTNSGNAYNQENGAIGNFFNGTTSNDLANIRGNYGNQSQGAINNLGGKLNNLGQNYNATQTGNIQNYSGDLARTLGNWGTAGNANIGSAASALNGSTNAYNQNASGTIYNEGSQLGGILGKYSGTGASLNTGASADLAKIRGDYSTDQNAKIQQEISARQGLEDQYGNAARTQTDLAIAGADRARKAQQDVVGGSGDSSYFGRMAIGARVQANADLASKLAALSNQDYGITRNEQLGLDTNLNGQARGDYNTVYGQNVALNQNAAQMGSANARTTSGQQLQLASDVANQQQNATRFTTGMNQDLLNNLANQGFRNTTAVNGEQMNLGNQLFTTGREDASQLTGDQLRLNEDMANRARSDYGFTTDTQLRTLGQRQALGQNYANSYLNPIQANQTITAGNYRNLGALGQLDQANTFYGLNNGQANNAGMFAPNGGGYRPGSNRMAPQMNPQTGNGVAPNGAPNGNSPQSNADQLYFQQTGVWPQQDPNFNAGLYSRLGGGNSVNEGDGVVSRAPAQNNYAVPAPNMPDNYWDNTNADYSAYA